MYVGEASYDPGHEVAYIVAAKECAWTVGVVCIVLYLCACMHVCVCVCVCACVCV